MINVLKFLFKYEKKSTLNITILLFISAVFESLIFMCLIPIINISLGNFENDFTLFFFRFKYFFSEISLLYILTLLIIILIGINSFIIFSTSKMLKYSFSLGDKYSSKVLTKYLRMYINNENEMNFNKSNILNKATTDMERFSVYIGLSYCNFIHKSFLFLILYSALLIFNTKITLIITCFFSGIYALIIIVLLKSNKYYKNLMHKSSNEKFYFAKALLNGIETLDIYNKVLIFLEYFKKKSRNYMISRSKSEFFTYFPKNLLELISLSIILIILIYFLKAKVNLSDYLPVLSAYIVIGYRLIPSIQNIYANSARLQTHSNIIDDILPIIESKSYRARLNEDFEEFKELIIKNLSFKYQNKKIINNLSFKIKKGETICIVGNSGVGKSTLLKIIIGFIKKNEGEILLNSKIIKDYNLIKNYIGFIPQQPFIVKGDLSFNLSLNNKIDTEKETKISKMLKITNFGLDESFTSNKDIEEDGANISAGQKQRLELLRAIYFDSEILILDEPTANLDKKIETKIINELISMKKTLIIVTHSKDIIKSSNRILFLKEDNTFFYGTYEELLVDDEFKKLFQFV